MERRLRAMGRFASLMGMPLFAMLTMVAGGSLADGPNGVSPAPSCSEFEALMRAGKVPFVRLNTNVWSGSNSVRPSELTALDTGRALAFPDSPAVYVVSVPAKIGGIREALMQGGYIVNGVADPYNAIPAGTLIPLVQKGATVPVNVEMLFCGWVVSTIALTDRLRPLDLPEALWQFSAIVAGPSPGVNEPAEAQSFRATVQKRRAEQALRLATGASSGAVDPRLQSSTNPPSHGRPNGSEGAGARGTPNAMPAVFTAGSTRFVGEFVQDPGNASYSGTGRVLWANGDIYEGKLVIGLREGTGKFIWSNGQRFEGEWLHDRPKGQGTMWFVNGDVYEGNIDDGAPNGQGRIKYASGDRYEGQFRNGIAHGRGAYTWVSGQRIDGDWVEGQGQGQGNMRFANGDMYDGTVSGGSPNGRGRMIYASGDMYVGTFKNGLPDGEGTFIWKRGDQYKGQWRSGVKDGPGVMMWENGDRWQGTYRDDRQGEGALTRAAN